MYNFVHNHAPSLGQLMPTYTNALKFKPLDNERKIEQEKNIFLITLNIGGVYKNDTYIKPDKIQERTSGIDVIFLGNGQKTIKTIYVDTLLPSSDNLYKDGVPNFGIITTLFQDLYDIEYLEKQRSNLLVDSNGDGTVPESSAEIGGIPVLYRTNEIEHAFLINNLKKRIVDFITN